MWKGDRFAVLRTLVLGIVQGLTEFLPISSSAHLSIVPKLMGFRTPELAFDVLLHFGTLAAVVLYFARDLWSFVLSLVAPGVLGAQQAAVRRRQLGLLVIASIPAAIFGYLLQDWADAQTTRPLRSAAWLVATTLIMIAAELWARSHPPAGVATEPSHPTVATATAGAFEDQPPVPGPAQVQLAATAARPLTRAEIRRQRHRRTGAAPGPQGRRHRPGPGGRADPRHEQVGGDHLRRPVRGHLPRGRGPLLVPAVDPGDPRCGGPEAGRAVAGVGVTGAARGRLPGGRHLRVRRGVIPDPAAADPHALAVHLVPADRRRPVRRAAGHGGRLRGDVGPTRRRPGCGDRRHRPRTILRDAAGRHGSGGRTGRSPGGRG